MEVVKLLRNLTLKKKALAPEASPPKKDLGTGFLDLPGELRNQIYAYAVCPNLAIIQISSCTRPEHLGSGVLSPAIFRASRQVRAEALSYLCATKLFQFHGIQCANVFFTVIGPAISEIKDILVEQPASELLRTTASRASVASFFAFIEQATALEVLEVSGLGRMLSIGNGGVHGEFLRSLARVGERGVKVGHWFGRARR
ncbi:hypothetical protein J1614_011682 [Plenodomus biglobosus]|nr:hypothetical protein J1614_011682 [Plenodomus biglobosus]